MVIRLDKKIIVVITVGDKLGYSFFLKCALILLILWKLDIELYLIIMCQIILVLRGDAKNNGTTT